MGWAEKMLDRLHGGTMITKLIGAATLFSAGTILLTGTPTIAATRVTTQGQGASLTMAGSCGGDAKKDDTAAKKDGSCGKDAKAKKDGSCGKDKKAKMAKKDGSCGKDGSCSKDMKDKKDAEAAKK
jgi:hypothetical protein